MLFGNSLLAHLGISLAALRTAGGILLLLIAIDMVFARHSGGTSATADESEEAEHKADISVFPLATPMIAGRWGPSFWTAESLMGAVNLPTAIWWREAVVLGALLAVLALTWRPSTVAAGRTKRVLLHVTGSNVISRDRRRSCWRRWPYSSSSDGIATSGLVT